MSSGQWAGSQGSPSFGHSANLQKRSTGVGRCHNGARKSRMAECNAAARPWEGMRVGKSSCCRQRSPLEKSSNSRWPRPVPQTSHSEKVQKKSNISRRMKENPSREYESRRSAGPVTCLEAEAEVEESSVPQGTQEVVAALKGCHQDGARDNFCREEEMRRLMSLTTQVRDRCHPPGHPYLLPASLCAAAQTKAA